MTKYYLRESMKGIVPKIRLRVDKNGFNTPKEEWFRSSQFQTLVQDILDSELFRSRGIIDPNKASELFQQYLKGKIDISKEIWEVDQPGTLVQGIH